MNLRFSNIIRRSCGYARDGVIVASLCLMVACSGSVDDAREGGAKNFPRRDQKSWLDEVDPIDRDANLTRQDYLKALNPPVPEDEKPETPMKMAMPELSDFISEPESPFLENDKLVTLSVTENVPVKEVLIELARRAEIDIEIDPGITGGVIIIANEKPLSDVIGRIARQAGLRYEIKEGILKVERDLPFVRNYRMNILDINRTSTGSVSINTNLLGGGNGNITSGSTSTLDAASGTTDFWGVIEEGVANILSQFQSGSAGGGGTGGATGTGLSGQPVAAAPGGAAAGQSASSLLSVNRQAGLVSVLATERQHSAVKEYLDYIHISHSSQVLIEAKILEVSLDDEYRSGINWNFVSNDVVINSGFDDIGNLASNDLFTVNVLPNEIFGLDGTSIDATIDLIDQFGVSRTLSSPRINAMNNQFAVLTFAENFVYFELDVEEETEDNDGQEVVTLTIDSTIQTVPIGVLLGLQPSIDLQNNEIVMNVRPTLSRINDFVVDPGVAIIAAQNNVDGIVSEIPVVEVRELDTVLRIKNGQVMVIGGLMEERSTNNDRGVPGLAKTPIIGNAFKSVVKDTEVVETVIFIKATIVPGQGVSVEDKEFYRHFTRDSRPLKL